MFLSCLFLLRCFLFLGAEVYLKWGVKDNWKKIEKEKNRLSEQWKGLLRSTLAFVGDYFTFFERKFKIVGCNFEKIIVLFLDFMKIWPS